jgi:hypothetical protein
VAKKKKMTRRELADEAYRRSLQTDITTVAPEPSVRDYPKLDKLPAECPECHRKWSAAGGVTLIVRADQRQIVFLEQVQCSACAQVFLIDTEEYEALRSAMQAHANWLAARSAPLPKKERRTRGAG